jgi:rare lipoprotein A
MTPTKKIAFTALAVTCGLISTMCSTKSSPLGHPVVIEAKVDGEKKFSGIASFYTKGMKGKTASGVKYDETKLKAAHKTLPFGTRVTVTCTNTNRSVTVVINDRGPFVKGRVIDLSYAAASALGLNERGLTRVTAVLEQ